MTVVNFETARELQDYANAQGLVQADIVSIQHVASRWYLFHF